MCNARRLAVATLMALFCGLVCLGLAASCPGPLPTAVGFQIVAERTLIGVAIGISCLPVHWSIHGLVLGAVFSIPLALSGLMAPDSPQFGKPAMFAMTVGLGAIYGVVIELVTSVVFRLRAATL